MVTLGSVMKIIPFPSENSSNPLIRSMWVVEESDGVDIRVKAFPTGYPYLNVICGTTFSIRDHQNAVTETMAYLSGNSRYPFELNMRVIRRALTIQLQPYAIPYLTGIPADEFSDLRVPLDAFSRVLSDFLGKQINSDRESVEVLRNVNSFFDEFADNLTVDPRILGALHEVLNHRGAISPTVIGRGLHLGQRRLQQLFKRHMGMSLKSYTEIVRIQARTYDLLKGRTLDSVVPDGYYDQSHFIHSLKKQTGMSPTAFQKFITSSEHHGAYYISNLFYGT